MDSEQIVEAQKAVCARYAIAYHEAALGKMIGEANNVKDTKGVINGLRHQPTKTTTGWYVWAGEQEPSEDDNFFKPMHLEHFIKEHPEFYPYLGLDAGSRFLINPKISYEDVWTDKTLLNIYPFHSDLP